MPSEAREATRLLNGLHNKTLDAVRIDTLTPDEAVDRLRRIRTIRMWAQLYRRNPSLYDRYETELIRHLEKLGAL